MAASGYDDIDRLVDGDPIILGRKYRELREAVRVYLEIHGRRLKWVTADGNGTWSDMFNEEQGQIARLRSLAGVEDTTEEKPDA